MYDLALHSSPPIRTRPPIASTRWRTTAFAPSSAAAPVRIARGIFTCARAIGRRKASEASAPTMKTTVSSQSAPPSAAARAAATAASATGPRKNIPGVKISPTASATATRAQTSQAGIASSLRLQTEMRKELVQRLDPRLEFRMEPVAVEKDRAHPDGERALDVVADGVPHHHRLGGLGAEQLEHGAEDRRVRLRAAVVEGADPRVDVEAVVERELAHVACGVGDQADAQPGRAEVV